MKFSGQLTILWMMAALLMISDSGAANKENRISYAQGQLSANVVEMSLQDVLSVVAEEAELEFVFSESLAARKVSISFDKLSLEKAIKRIIRPLSCSMIFGSSGRLQKVIILESGSNSVPVTVSEKDDDPSLGPAGRPDEELRQNEPGLGPEGETAIPSEGEDYDPSLGPAGRLGDGPPPSAPGLSEEGGMADQPRLKDPGPPEKGQ